MAQFQRNASVIINDNKRKIVTQNIDGSSVIVGTLREASALFLKPSFSEKSVHQIQKRDTGQRRRLKGTNNLLLRVDQIAGPRGILPISKSTWWAGVKDGRFPQPIKLGDRVTAWNKDEVMALLRNGVLKPENDV